jgi:glycosyltransferase involved in cell wall biosynthesis
MERRPKVCVVSPAALPLIKGRDNSHIGGAEVQMVTLARELAKRSYEVSFLVAEQYDTEFEVIDGIRVYSPINVRYRSSFAYFQPQNLLKLVRTLNRIDADIIIQRPGSPLTGILSVYARLKNRKFVFSTSSDKNVSSHLVISRIHDLPLFPYVVGIRLATMITCQTMKQQALLHDTCGRTGQVIKNFHIPSNHHAVIPPAGAGQRILWVGRIIPLKRPEIYLELAQHLPDLQFEMVGDCSQNEEEYFRRIKQSAEQIPNLTFVSTVSHHDIHKYFAGKAIFVSTSSSEGFPNTFLEAWGNAIPVVSLDIDPDDVIRTHQLGYTVDEFEGMVARIGELIEDEELRARMGANGRKFVEDEHRIEKVIDEYQHLFTQLLAGTDPSAG